MYIWKIIYPWWLSVWFQLVNSSPINTALQRYVIDLIFSFSDKSSKNAIVWPSVHVSLVSLFLPLSDFQKLIRKNIMEHNRVH